MTTQDSFSSNSFDHSAVAWYALRVRTRTEIQTAIALEAKGLDIYVPSNQSEKKWADRTKITHLPLFPGYVFSRFNVERRLPVLTTPNVIEVVGLGRMPTPVPDAEILNLHLLQLANLPQTAVDMPTTGETVLIGQGPLAGVEGVLISAKRGSRLLVSVTILRRAVSVEIEQAWISGSNSLKRNVRSGAAA